MSDIEVLSRTQRVVMNPPTSGIEVFSRAQRIIVTSPSLVTVVTTGPIGPGGLQGKDGTAPPRFIRAFTATGVIGDYSCTLLNPPYIVVRALVDSPSNDPTTSDWEEVGVLRTLYWEYDVQYVIGDYVLVNVKDELVFDLYQASVDNPDTNPPSYEWHPVARHPYPRQLVEIDNVSIDWQEDGDALLFDEETYRWRNGKVLTSAVGEQVTESSVWIIDHNLKYLPAAVKFFSQDGEDELEPEEITYVDNNRILATWPEPIAGTWMVS